MSKHTRGPWEVKHSESKDAWNVLGTTWGCRYKIARCPYLVTEGHDALSRMERDEQEANAKLIAAAPALLEACQMAMAACKVNIEAYDRDGLVLLEAYHACRMAIEKANAAQKPEHSSKDSLYGYCPICGEVGRTRERRLNGNDTCVKGHVYPTKDAMH